MNIFGYETDTHLAAWYQQMCLHIYQKAGSGNSGGCRWKEKENCFVDCFSYSYALLIFA